MYFFEPQLNDIRIYLNLLSIKKRHLSPLKRPIHVQVAGVISKIESVWSGHTSKFGRSPADVFPGKGSSSARFLASDLLLAHDGQNVYGGVIQYASVSHKLQGRKQTFSPK